MLRCLECYAVQGALAIQVGCVQEVARVPCGCPGWHYLNMLTCW